MTALPPEILAELQIEYIKGFSLKISALSEALLKKDWNELREVLHKLAGSGSTYQMPDITENARAAEIYLDQTKAPDVATITAQVITLKKTLQKYMSEAA